MSSATTFSSKEELHEFLRRYHAEIQRDVSSSKGHIYYSRPTSRWILVQARGGKIKVSFHAECPCDKT